VKLGTARRVVEKIRQWFAEIVAAVRGVTGHFSRPAHITSNTTAESRTERAAVKTEAIAVERRVAESPTTTLDAGPAAADSKIGQSAQVNGAAISPDDQEIQRRRNLVRTLFNDFWSASDNKPASFADRLDQAETYLNERLTASGEVWRLDGNTRVTLGLPPRSNLPNEAKRGSDH
jgi:hypothetical protein